VHTQTHTYTHTPCLAPRALLQHTAIIIVDKEPPSSRIDTPVSSQAKPSEVGEWVGGWWAVHSVCKANESSAQLPGPFQLMIETKGAK